MGYQLRSGVPILSGAATVLVCDLETTVRLHDHTLFVGRVVQADIDVSQDPLIHHRRSQHTLARRDAGRPKADHP